MTESSNGQTENVIIVGSGPAGWTAAIYAARANLSPLVFPGRAAGKDLVPGGQLMLTTDVENYPGFPEGISGPDMMIKFYEQAMRFDTRVATDDGIKANDDVSGGLFTPSFLDAKQVDLSQRPFKVTGDNGSVYHAHALIVATGAKAKWLGLENEHRLATTGGGVSACAVCDGALPMFRDQPLGVVGGGDTAMEEALYLAKYASQVHIFVRRDKLRASEVMAERARKNEKIQFHWHTEVTDVLGDEKITGVKLINNQTDEASQMELGGLFLAIGHKPITDFLEGQVEMDEVGYIQLADPSRSTTSVEGVFAAGDVADAMYRQAVTAAGMGCRAAIDAERWLGEQGID